MAPEIAQLARTTGHDLKPVAALYFGVGARLGLDRLRLLAARITASEHWDRLAIRRLVDDLFAAQRALSQSLLATLPKTATADHALKALADWAALQADALGTHPKLSGGAGDHGRIVHRETDSREQPDT